MQALLNRYSNLPGNIDLVFRSLCALISDQPDKVDWSKFDNRDWALFERMAVDEHVAGMAYYYLRANPERYRIKDFDRHTYQILSEQEAIYAIRNAILFRHLWSILQQLQQQEIPTILLKGADLAQTIYPEPGLRWMVDLDLLVSKSQFDRVLKLVKNRGYYFYIPEMSPGLYRLLGRHAHLKKDYRMPILLDLHWSLIGNEAFTTTPSLDWIWQNLEPCHKWGGKNHPQIQNYIFTLNPTAKLLYLTAHQLIQHADEQASLKGLLDIHLLVLSRQSDVDWGALSSQARLFGWKDSLDFALAMVKECFASPVPGTLFPPLSQQVEARSVSRELDGSMPETRTSGEWKILRCLSWQARLRLLTALLLPTPAYMRYRYQLRSGWLLPFYYIYRFFDIAGDGIRTVLRMAHRAIKNT